MSTSLNSPFPLDLADRCVKCGLCLPHCPTYKLTENEAESPRGRIMLMQGLATGQLEQSSKLESHLDQCLTCRACEAVCPADVPYGELIDKGRAQLKQKRINKPLLGSRLLSCVLTRPGLRRVVGFLLRAYQKSGLQWMVRRGHLLGNSRLARLESFLPEIPAISKPTPSNTEQGPARGRVALFTGCVSEWLESDVLQDAVALLNACGYDVDVPRDQGCCGALHQHEGDLKKSRDLAEKNINAFAGDYDAILGVASGCTSMLSEYALMSDAGMGISQTSMDISQFLLEHWPDDLKLRPDIKTVAIHDPCSLRNVLKQDKAPYAVLEKIPGIQLEALADNGTCCGAAGSYFINQPEMSDQLGEKKLEAIKAQSPDVVATSNIGCGMQFNAQLRKAGLNIPVMHPISLLRQQLASE